MPTLDKRSYDALFGRFSNTSAMSVFSSLHDVLGRRLNARNVFDLALYTTLYQLGSLEGTTCVLPWPNATDVPRVWEPDPEADEPQIPPSKLPPFQHLAAFGNRDEVFICTQPRLEPSNRTLDEGEGGARRALEGYADDELPEEGVEVAQEEGEEGGWDAAVGAGAAPRRLAEAAGAPHELFDDWDAWGENAGDWDWRHAIARRDARRDAERGAGGEAAAGRAARRADATRRAAAAAAAASGGTLARVRSAPRRRLLYHEFEIHLNPYDFWLDENAEERAGRARRDAARLGGDCRFYHNCSAPVAPPLKLHPFECRRPNVTLSQEEWTKLLPYVKSSTPTNVTWLQTSMESHRKRHGQEVHQYYTRICDDELARPYPWRKGRKPPQCNFTHNVETVLCIQPSWPNSTGVSCLTPAHGVYCPYTDEYRGNQTSLFALGAEWVNGKDFVDETMMRCDAWPRAKVYERVASAGLLYHVPANATARTEPCTSLVGSAARPVCLRRPIRLPRQSEGSGRSCTSPERPLSSGL